jgi:hypothetical protein
MLQHAFKEWAVICKALGEGTQALILRKGGIAETGNDFQVEQRRFWLFPTYTHQQRAGIKPEAIPLLEQVEAERPPPGMVCLSHFAEVTGMYHVHDLVPALVLNHLHIWSEETVRMRFAYRTPGIYVLPVRVYRATQTFELPDIPKYAGCRSWVELHQPLPTDGAVPVLNDEPYSDLVKGLDKILKPTAFV